MMIRALTHHPILELPQNRVLCAYVQKLSRAANLQICSHGDDLVCHVIAMSRVGGNILGYIMATNLSRSDFNL